MGIGRGGWEGAQTKRLPTARPPNKGPVWLQPSRAICTTLTELAVLTGTNPTEFPRFRGL